jgi:DNA modification methylase
MTYQRKETLADGIDLYLGDCREILPTLHTVDAVVTDPPYGIRVDENRPKTRSFGWADYGDTSWDRERPDKKIIESMLAISDHQIIWGGNYFADLLPPTMQWLIWDKGQRKFSLADFEVAWSSQNAAGRIIDYPRARALRDGKEHPTQKPVEVMEWCIGRLPKSVTTILDPFMGSGTTGVACVKLGRKFTGIELEPKYFDISCRRISGAIARPDLFIERPKQPEQEVMDI